MNDFLKFATAQGMNSMHVEQVMHDSMAAQPRANYISPSILEERQLNVDGCVLATNDGPNHFPRHRD